MFIYIHHEMIYVLPPRKAQATSSERRQEGAEMTPRTKRTLQEQAKEPRARHAERESPSRSRTERE